MNKVCAFSLAILGVMVSSISPSFAAEKPNVVLMMMDNLGWGEVGAYGGGILRGAETPRIDALADEGMKLLNFNVEPQCTPSRSALMSGRHPIRSGTTKVASGSVSNEIPSISPTFCQLWRARLGIWYLPTV